MKEFMDRIVDNITGLVKDVWYHTKDVAEFVATMLGVLLVLPLIPLIMLVLFVRESFRNVRRKQ